MNPKKALATALATASIACGSAQEAQNTNLQPQSGETRKIEQTTTSKAFAPFNLYFENMTGGEANSVAAVLGDIQGSNPFHTLRREATGAEVDLESLLNAVDVNEDGTGTYRLEGPIAFQGLNAHASRVIDGEHFYDAHLDVLTHHEATLSEHFKQVEAYPLMGVGATPLDAIARMLASAHAQTAIKSTAELENRSRWSTSIDATGMKNEDYDHTSRLEERTVAGSYGILAVPNDIVVQPLIAHHLGVDVLIGYQAESDGALYAVPTEESLGGSTPNLITRERK
jgi:hypothetical protein